MAAHHLLRSTLGNLCPVEGISTGAYPCPPAGSPPPGYPAGKNFYSGIPRYPAGLICCNDLTGNSAYHGGTLEVNKTGGKHFNLNASYTLSHTMDDGTFATFISVPEDVFRRSLERATSNQDARHRLVSNFSFTGPDDTFLKKFVLSNIVILQSPRPFTLFVGFDANNDLIPAADRVGNLSRNTYKGDSFQSWDVRLSRAINLGGDRTRLEVAFDAFNVLNRHERGRSRWRLRHLQSLWRTAAPAVQRCREPGHPVTPGGRLPRGRPTGSESPIRNSENDVQPASVATVHEALVLRLFGSGAITKGVAPGWALHKKSEKCQEPAQENFKQHPKRRRRGDLPQVFRPPRPSAAMTYLTDRAIAPPGQEGWTRHQEKYREASFDGADGVVVQDQTEMFLNLNHHPVCAASDASHFLLTGAATPPGQEGRWPGPPSMLLPPSLRTFVQNL